MKELQWFVFMDNRNSKTIEPFNVFRHRSFREDCVKAVKESENISEFKNRVCREIKYYFWAKCEFEIILSSWPNASYDVKVDISDQLLMNIDRFADYVWNTIKGQ